MATNSTTTALIVGLGAITDFILHGEWTWKSLVRSIAGGFAGYAIALILHYYLPGAETMPDPVKVAISYVVGILATTIIRRIKGLSIKAKIAGIEIESNGDEK